MALKVLNYWSSYWIGHLEF